MQGLSTKTSISAGGFEWQSCAQLMYADDLLLIAPTRGAMQQMLKVCEDYAVRYNIRFSTDPNPTKSKSKCIFIIGKRNNLTKPVNLMLGVGGGQRFLKTVDSTIFWGLGLQIYNFLHLSAYNLQVE